MRVVSSCSQAFYIRKGSFKEHAFDATHSLREAGLQLQLLVASLEDGSGHVVLELLTQSKSTATIKQCVEIAMAKLGNEFAPSIVVIDKAKAEIRALRG